MLAWATGNTALIGLEFLNEAIKHSQPCKQAWPGTKLSNTVNNLTVRLCVAFSVQRYKLKHVFH